MYLIDVLTPVLLKLIFCSYNQIRRKRLTHLAFFILSQTPPFPHVVRSEALSQPSDDLTLDIFRGLDQYN